MNADRKAPDVRFADSGLPHAIRARPRPDGLVRILPARPAGDSPSGAVDRGQPRIEMIRTDVLVGQECFCVTCPTTPPLNPWGSVLPSESFPAIPRASTEGGRASRGSTGRRPSERAERPVVSERAKRVEPVEPVEPSEAGAKRRGIALQLGPAIRVHLWFLSQPKGIVVMEAWEPVRLGLAVRSG